MYQHTSLPTDGPSDSNQAFTAPSRPDHGVHFYQDDASLFGVVSEFLAVALRASQRVVVIATEPHARAFESGLAARQVDVDAGAGATC